MSGDEARWADDIFSLSSAEAFDAMALRLFRHQALHCEAYAQWLRLLGVEVEQVQQASQIPFLPIECFKSHRVTTFATEPAGYFQSSGTTGMSHSRHYYRSLALYDRSLLEGFRRFWGDPAQYCFVALLPNYLRQGHSSLIYMMRRLIEASGCPQGGFFEEVTPELLTLLREGVEGRRLLLFGVTYALLDIAERHKVRLRDAVVFETGGMKGRRKEMVKEELHQQLCDAFGVEAIASEYGMCELFSQAYSRGGNRFATPPWMQVSVRDIYAPQRRLSHERTGGLNVVDLANVDSCCFIATQDLARTHADGTFEVLGRFDHSDVRGCNLMCEM